ncbi:MAG TPA: SRPBCC family protein [Blastocatellia bacterium]|nr:SRPBCC family protein [Blastocatellia bacterium]
MMRDPFDIDERLERASTLSSRFYTDPQTLEIERRKIFHSTWQYVGRTEQLPEPGSFFTIEVGGEPVLIAKNREGELKAFHNVCRHRAGPVATASGCRSSFQCGYHGWTYSLDGRLLATPEFDGVENFRKENMGLIPIAVEVWEGSIFVNILAGKASYANSISLSDLLEDIPQRTSGLRMADMRLVQRRDYSLQCNWKVYIDNYLEGYHIPIVHPSLMRELDYIKYETITRRYYSLQHSPIKQSKDNERYPRRYSSPEQQTEALYYWIFPNLMLNIYPDNFSINLILPISHENTLTVFEWYFVDPRADTTRQAVEKTIEFSDEIQVEDINICEAVQKGLKSASYDRGRYSVRRENGVHHFHLLYRDFMSRQSREELGSSGPNSSDGPFCGSRESKLS